VQFASWVQLWSSRCSGIYIESEESEKNIGGEEGFHVDSGRGGGGEGK